ncbi:TetR/AcrR family transcriptional regulator [Planctomycetota bacterium]|nr:TetR/AcrR family transcriptional regulator [Planctomycetota bacterium]
MKQNQAQKILAAAAIVVQKQGIANLTIDGVAKTVGMSKGGVLHHFRTKDQLIEALVRHTAEGFLRSTYESYESVPPGPGRMVRGLIENCLDNSDVWTKEIRGQSSAIFAALAHEPKLLKPMRDAYDELFELLKKDNLPPGVSETVLAALDGIWFRWVLGFGPVDQSLFENVSKTLRKLIEDSID